MSAAREDSVGVDARLDEAAGGEGIRLAKRVAAQVPCSRAEAERYIAGGWVGVDGAVVEDPATRVTPAQAVALLPGATAEEPLPVTILLHKPAGVACSALAADPAAHLGAATLAPAQGGPGAQRFLQRHLARLTLATPLDTEASGLVVLSQDWRMLRKLVDDGARIEHEYVVETAAAIGDEALQAVGAAFAGGNAAVKVSRQSEARLRIAGKGIAPSRVGAACRAAGLEVKAIRRLRVGRIAVGSLAAGRWRYLQEFERF